MSQDVKAETADEIVISPTRENILMIDYIYDRLPKIHEEDFPSLVRYALSKNDQIIISINSKDKYANDRTSAHYEDFLRVYVALAKTRNHEKGQILLDLVGTTNVAVKNLNKWLSEGETA